MRRTGPAIGGAVSLMAFMLLAAPGASAHSARLTGSTLHGTLTWNGAPMRAPARSAIKGMSLTASHVKRTPRQLAAERAAGTTVPTFSATVEAGQNSQDYTFTMLGANPTNSNTTTTVQAQIIPVTVTFAGTGDVYSPLTTNTACGQTQSSLTGELNSPEFKIRKWYAGKTYVGNDQYTDAQMREEWWDWTNPKAVSPNWHLRLAASVPIGYDLTVSGFPETDPGTCFELGEIDYTTWDNYFENTVMPALASDGVSPATFPIFLVNNVVLTNPVKGGGLSCCIFGYHSSYDNPAYATNTQTYAFTDYITDDEFGGTTDIAGSSHEIAEWANDPYGNNPVPSWGHTGQDPNSCQGNLEVGDPLTGNVFAVEPETPGGFTYHLQELAFFGWFYDFNSGVNGWYSTRGSFTTGATICTS